LFNFFLLLFDGVVATSHLTLDPTALIAAKLFLSSGYCPDTETWRQATTNIVHSIKFKLFISFIRGPPYGLVAEQCQLWIRLGFLKEIRKRTYVGRESEELVYNNQHRMCQGNFGPLSQGFKS
jgi:hypothetical protein